MVNSIVFTFAFAPIGVWSNPLPAFALIRIRIHTPVHLHAFPILVAFSYILAVFWQGGAGNMTLRETVRVCLQCDNVLILLTLHSAEGVKFPYLPILLYHVFVLVQ